jgi:hypothetical protein
MKERIPLEALFSFSHVNPPTLSSYFLLLLYSPLGLVLIVFRIICLLLVLLLILATPPSFTFPPWLVGFFLPFFGIIARAKNFQPSYASLPIIACNHTTPFDVFPFMKLTNVNVLIDHGFFESSFLARQFKKIVGAVPIKR